MDYSALDLIQLVALIIDFNDHDAFNEFHSRTQSIIEIAFKKHWHIASAYDIEYEEYETAVLGWVYEKNKLLFLLEKYRELEGTGSVRSQDSFVRGYYYRILSSAFIEYLHEIRPEYKPEVFDEDDTDEDDTDIKVIDDSIIQIDVSQDSDDCDGDGERFPIYYNENMSYQDSSKYSIDEYFQQIEEEEQILQAVDLIMKLPPSRRIPVWLTYFVRRVPLPGEDLEFLAELNECKLEFIRKAIEEAIAENMHKTYSVPSKVISALMQISQNNVSVRVRRAKKELLSGLEDGSG